MFIYDNKHVNATTKRMLIPLLAKLPFTIGVEYNIITKKAEFMTKIAKLCIGNSNTNDAMVKLPMIYADICP